jgi:glucose-1-phosphate thymidylyltransferase
MNDKMTIIGLIPACGKAERLSPLPCSKEIFPIGLQHSSYTNRTFPKVMSDHILTYYKEAGVNNVYFIIRNDKQDIPRYFSKRNDLDLDIRFLELNHSPSTPFTLDSAYPIVKDRITALGFPDIMIRPTNAFKQVIDKLVNSDLDVALGLFPIERKYSYDMVEIAEERVVNIVIKSPDTQLKYGWVIAIWKPSFAEFMHRYMKNATIPSANEMYVGNVIQAAIDSGLKVGYELFENGACIDLGKPEDLAMIYREW